MNVVRNYMYNAGYQLLTLIVPFITVPYIARVLGPEGVGINSYTNSIMTYFLLLGTLGITVYGNREIAYHRDDFEQRTKTFWEIELLQVVTVVVAYGLFVIFVLFQTTYKGYFLLQSLWIIAGVFDISWLFMGMEDFKKTVLRNSLVKIASLIAIFTLVKSRSDVGIYIMILGAAQVLGNLTLWPYLHTVVGKPKINFAGMISHLKPTIVLFIPQIATQVYLQLNRTMLGQFDSVTAAGYYDFADKLVKMVLAVITATGTVMLPHMAHLAAQGSQRRLNRLLYKSFSFSSLLALPLMFGLAAIANSLVPLYYGPKFSIVSQLIIIEAPVALLIGWSNVIGLQYLMPLKRVKDYTASVTYGALANIVINVPLIMTLGVSGATIATVISEVVVTAYQLFVIRDMVSYRNLFADGWKFLVAAVTMFIPVFWLNMTMSVTAVSLALQVTLGIGIYFGILSILKPDILRDGLYFLKSRQK
ncbi:flippase [Levilactobacillus fujinensis]|uniref:Flippase n=1 Tax=Levilactobacillus fujinensis TaxID=2486024 RepID=A0ABW1TF79_9LACO|nr:flippase [Levilactobacillus fujinensis]